MRKRVTTGAPGASEGRQRLLVSRVKRMHMMVPLCKKPGLSCPKTGVIVSQNRGYRVPNFFDHSTNSHIYRGF
jgi:hypothetical protein